ncbi:hypothetical protein [Novosphingobium malaysiense]|uniref:hypothetical protein n=1 Tax=Novosphingobium malaysiense TaxID=1348853 RepID=UPI0018CDDD1F|nr:hypothetical protein [Novosphingobium malaysiense]
MSKLPDFSSERIEVDLDAHAFNREAWEIGWGDGLPLLPPTPEVVARYIDAAGISADTVVCNVPPRFSDCTVENVAINAAMTGAPEAAMPLLIAALRAMGDGDFALSSVNSTTAPVVEGLIVNGPMRHELGLPMSHSVFGGMRSTAPAIGRTLRLIMRHVGGQEGGTTSQSVFGQPARVCGMVMGEWEEKSPWAPFAERRGVSGDAVTVIPMMGTANIVDTFADTADAILTMLARSIAYMGANAFLAVTRFSDFTIALNPVWATIVANEHPDITEVEQLIWQKAGLSLDEFPPVYAKSIAHRADEKGFVQLLQAPTDLNIIVCGSEGSLHSAMLPGFSHSLAVTRPVDTFGAAAQRPMLDKAQLEQAISGFSAGLVAEGYNVITTPLEGGRVSVEIQPIGDVCPTCLAPAQIMGPMAALAIRKAGIEIADSDVEMIYPAAAEIGH